ncbi:MAG: discoidin domain-containing protein [Gemmatimonadaceae bacterium]|nr:discoidin domain-containing protein [Gemmatimonadaceae bacterium]
MTRRRMYGAGAFAALVLAAGARAQSLPSSARLLDGFESTAGWSAHPSDGVSLTISADSTGVHGRAMRLDFDFHGHGGYAIARKTFDVALPENYAFSYRIRGEAPPENFEVKLIDSTGDNVWWNNAVNVHFPEEWRTVTLKKRHITFAWGPRGGGQLAHLATLELSITAGGGGKGTVWIDALTFTPLEPVHAYTGTPVATATSASPGHAAAQGADEKAATSWESERSTNAQSFALDFGTMREYGGATIDWAPGAAAASYVVQTSADGAKWDSAYAVVGGNGGRDWIYLPETESRWLRVRIPASSTPRAYAVRELAVIPVAWSATRNDFFAHIAASAPAGSYPKYLGGKQSYWTVVGVDGDDADALINEQGAIEPHAGGFSLEPFLRVGGKLVTWHDARQTQSLAKGYLPIPSVTWIAGALRLQVTTFAAGAPDSSSLYARYRITNTGKTLASPTLYLAVRPFQVNPSWQFLATQGGDAPVRSIAWEDTLLRVNDSWTVVPLTAPAAVGASTFDEGEIVESLRAGSLPARHDVRDAMEHASAAMSYPLSIPAGESRDVYVLVPMHEHGALSRPFARVADARAFAARTLARVTRTWDSTLNRASITLPRSASRVTETLRAQLAYILINDHGVQIHPGPRSYARSWIRDGSMIGAALLRLGHPEQVRAFLEWYAPYQFPNGKVPCCVDARGADPVPENDSHGELVYAIADYFRYTGDTAFLAQMWPHVTGAVAYMDSLRAQRLTPEYEKGSARAYRGLFPQSISHEGYSAKPMHSFWDDLFGLRGYADATFIATVLHHASEAKDLAAKRDTFRADIMASYRASMAEHHIDFLPGSVELGDFDATSTTVGVAPVGELASLPDTALRATFDKYWDSSEKRRSGAVAWDAYTPYELRTVGTFVRLGEKARALAMLDFFFQGQRPAAWREWAEVVWHDRDAPKFIGDMPHTWVGSDYIRSVLDMFAYDRASDSALVVGAGIAERWVREAPGVRVRALGTPYGPIDYDVRANACSLVAHLSGNVRVPPGGIVFRSPVDRPIASARVNGSTVTPSSNGEVVVRHLPATINLTY